MGRRTHTEKVLIDLSFAVNSNAILTEVNREMGRYSMIHLDKG